MVVERLSYLLFNPATQIVMEATREKKERKKEKKNSKPA